MKRKLTLGIIWTVGVVAGLAVSAQTYSDTNSSFTQTNAFTNINGINPNQPLWTMLTNQSAAGTNLNYLLGVTPSVPPLLGPNSVGNPYLQSSLAGNTVFNTPHTIVAGGLPMEPGIPIWGPIDLHPLLSYSFSHATDVAGQGGTRQTTIQQSISAGLLFDIGDHWTLDYVPTYSVYDQQTFQDTLSHAVVLRGGTSYGGWDYSLGQSYFTSSDSLLETGTQTSQEGFDTSIGAAHEISSKLTLQLGFDQAIRDTSGFDNVTTWSGNVGLSYALLPNLRTGLTLGGGYNSISLGSSMPYEVVQGTVAYQPGQKLSMFVSGGAEEMQFVDPSAPPLITPVFSASVQYQLFPKTALALSGSRMVTPSYFGNQVQVTTEVGASIRQVLSEKLSLTVNAGYTTEPLTSIVPQPLPQFFIGTPPTTYLAQTETLHSSVFGMTLSYAVARRVALSAYWSINDTTSSQANFRYSSTQVGFSATYTY